MVLITNGLLTNDVLRWKAIGAAAWVAAVTAGACAFWSLSLAPTSLLSPLRLLSTLVSPSAWLAVVALVLAQGPAFVAQAASLTTREPAPVLAHRLLQWPGAAPVAALLAKLAARTDSVLGAARVAAFLGLHALSALMCLSLFPSGRGVPSLGASWTLQYSLWLAALFMLHWVYLSRDVLLFPSVQRHRYFRIKQRLPGAAATAAKLAAAACAAAAATALLRAHASRAVVGAAAATSAAPPLLSLGGLGSALMGGSLCCFCWLMGTAVLEVVFTERLRADDYEERDVLAAMGSSLAGKKGDLMQGLALHDASLLASDVGKAALRRAYVFADETGDRWRPVAAACIAELDSLSSAVAAAAAQQKAAAGPGAAAGGAPSAGASQQSHKWNVLPSAMSSKGGQGSSKAQLSALLALRCGYPRAVLAADALAGFACASLAEDRFGVLQLTQPGLGDVLLCLLSALGATQQVMRASASLSPRHLALGPWRGNGDTAPSAGSHSTQAVDAAALALSDALTVCLYRVTATFGAGLSKVLSEAHSAPAYGAPGEGAALLQLFLAGQA